MKSLVVQHVFPGTGGGRVEKVVKYLPDFEIEPVVLSPADPGDPGRQKLFELQFPPNLKMYKARTFGPTFFDSRFHARGPAAKRYQLYKWLSLPERSIYVPDHMVRWVRSGKSVAKRIVADHEIDCVFTSSPRESTHLVGLWLRENYGIPWIADFRDLWTRKALAYRPATPLHNWWIRRMERRIMQTADHVVANTVENRETYLEDFGLPPEKVTVVPNGFDRDDLELAEPYEFPSARFRIGHMGSLTKTSYPWKLFLEAFSRLGREVGYENIEFIHCGNHTKDVTDYVRENNLDEIFSYHGALPHFDAMQLMAATNVQLVLLYENEDSRTLAPQKLYNYMILQGPVFSIAPEQGAVARVTAETSCGDVVSPMKGVDAIYEQLRQYYEAWLAGSLESNADPAAVARYDRRSQTGEIAQIMKDLARA